MRSLPACVCGPANKESTVERRQSMMEDDTGYQRNSPEKTSAKEAAFGGEQNEGKRGKKAEIVREDDRMTHMGQ